MQCDPIDAALGEEGRLGAKGFERRAFVFGSGAITAAAWLSTCGGARAQELRTPPGHDGGDDAKGEDGLDEALTLLHGAEPMSAQGLSTHAPMVADALCRLGHGTLAVKWIEEHRGNTSRLPKPSKRIEGDAWRAELVPGRDKANWAGGLARFGDWRVLFEEALAEGPWRDVLDTWAVRLAPGLCAAATHGVIRTGHAASALGRRENALRRAELARGLAYWAAAYQELPAKAGGTPRHVRYADALATLPSYRKEHHDTPRGNIVSGLRSAGELAGFETARDAVAAPEDVSAGLTELTGTFARAYLRHGTRHDTIAFVHAVTAPAALRRLAPHLKPETVRAALPYAWQAAAGIYAAYALEEDAEVPPEPKLPRDEIVERAVENGDAHTIKFAEALLAEHARAPDPAYLAAAEDVLERL